MHNDQNPKFHCKNFILAKDFGLATNNESTPVLSPPPAPAKPSCSSAPLVESVDNGRTNINQSPLALDLSGIERDNINRSSRSLNGSHLRLERQDAIAMSPDRPTSPSNEEIVSAIETNTRQLREMFGNLARQMDEVEKRMNQSAANDSDAEKVVSYDAETCVRS